MFTRKARKALRKSRQGKQSEYIELLRQGERARITNLGVLDNPYQPGTEESEIWLEGYNGDDQWQTP